MSATNRGAVRRERDFYETPFSAISPIMRRLQIGSSDLVVDPCSGSGRILVAARDFGAGIDGWDIELRDYACLDCVQRDSLSTEGWHISNIEAATGLTACIITNPPYSLAMEFVQRALEEAPGRLVCMLLPLSFLASKKRAEFHKTHPCHLFVLSKRPSFTEDKKTDAVDYGWYAWNYSGVNGWEIIDT